MLVAHFNCRTLKHAHAHTRTQREREGGGWGGLEGLDGDVNTKKK